MDQKFRTYYMDSALFDLQTVIDDAASDLCGVDFDTLVGTGFSGSIVIPSLALKMGKKFALLRKDTDDSHHGKGRLVGDLGQRWVFVDDFISSGATRKRVIERVTDAVRLNGLTSEMVGQYMYVSRWDGKGFEPFDSQWIDGSW